MPRRREQREELWPRIEALFDRAAELGEAQRRELLARERADDPAVVAEVEAMLEADARTGGPLDAAAGDLLETLVDELAGPEGEPPLAVGDYRILGKLGEGGMGVVYEAEQSRPRRRVALKVVRGGLLVDDLTRRLFEREADSLARLEHPNIAAIYEAGRTDDGRRFIAMELVRGDTLDRHLGKWQGRLSQAELERRLRLFGAIAHAVQYAHQRGVIHRDLKPSNLVVLDRETEKSGASGGLPTVKILDFGLARLAAEEGEDRTLLTTPGMIKGTVPYMSPEQFAAGDAVDVRTDVYSLGVVLYEMLTGERPYDVSGKGLVDAARIITETPHTPLRQLWRGRQKLDDDLRTIVDKALAKEPAQRYDSAGALADDIDRLLASQPILARPPSAMYQIRKLVSRNRLAAGLLATLLLLLLGFGLSMSLLWRRSETARTYAEASQLLALGRLEIAQSPSSALAYALAALERHDEPAARRFALEALWQGPTALLTSTAPTLSPTFSPDGRLLVFRRANLAASGEMSTDLVLLEAEGGAARRLGPSGGPSPFIGFTADSSHVLSKPLEEAEIQAWSVADGALSKSFPVAPAAGFLATGDRQRLVVFADQGPPPARTLVSSIVLDTGAVTELGAIPGPVLQEVAVVAALDATGERIAYTAPEGAVVSRLDDLAGGSAAAARVVAPAGWKSRAFHPTAPLLLAIDQGHELALWPLEGAAASEATASRRFGPVPSSGMPFFDASGRFLVAGVNTGEAWLWDLAGPPDAAPTVLRHRAQQSIWGGSFDPTGRWLATADNGGGTLWPLVRDYSARLNGHTGPVTSLAFDPAGRWLVSSVGAETEARRWPLAGSEPGFALPGGGARLVLVDPAGERLLLVKDGSFAELSSTAGGERRRLGGADLWCGAFSRDGRRVAVGGGQFVAKEALIRVWELETGEEVVLDAGDGAMVIDLGFLGDGRLVSSGKGGLRLWTVASGAYETLSGEPSAYIAISPDDATLFALVGEGVEANLGGQVFAYDLATGDRRRLVRHGDRVNHLAVDASGTRIATGDLDGIVRVGPLDGGEPHLLLGHQGPVNAVAFDPAGRWIASGGSDTTVRLWPIPEGPPLHTLPREELLSKLRALTNYRLVEDLAAPNGYRLEVGPFPGWETVPGW